MNKKTIIEMVDDISKNNLKDVLRDDSKSSYGNKDKEVGISQFISLANACKIADCVDEIKLLLQYKTAKGNGWEKEVASKKFGDLIIEKVNKIEKIVDESIGNREYDSDNAEEIEKEKLKAMSQFFGYLYWKAKVITSDKKG